MGFDLCIGKNEALFPQLGEIAKRYFSIDTATPDTAYEWYRHNPYAIITATIGDTVHGFADFLPLTSEAVDLLETRRLKEEDITPEHILPPETMRYCRALYFSGIAIRDTGNFLGARCAAALIAGHAHMLETVYKDSALKCIYSNPTTYSGNRLTRRMGFKPVSTHRKNMGGMDLYILPLDTTQRQMLNDTYNRYSPLINSIDVSLD